MKKNFVITLLVFCTVVSRAQIEGDFCHNQSRQLTCSYWLNYRLKFEDNKFNCLYTLDSSIYYDPKTKTIRVAIPHDTLTVELKRDGVELATGSNDNSVFLPISRSVEICDNKDEENLIRLNKIGNLRILPIINEKCKLKGLQLPLIQDKSISIFFFNAIEQDKLCWDIIINGLKGDYQDYNQIKLFADEFDGQVSSINFCYKNGGSTDYKNVEPGTEIIFTHNKTRKIIWKIRRVVETKLKDYVAYSDLIEYDKKGKVKAAKIRIDLCACK